MDFDLPAQLQAYPGELDAFIDRIVPQQARDRLCCEAADRAMRVRGGIGYSRRKPFEPIYRHHRRHRTEGSEQIQVRKVAGHLFGYMGANKF